MRLKVVGKLIAGETVSTAEVIEVLEEAGVDNMIIDYLAYIHAHKVEGKTSVPAHTAKRFKQSLDASIAVNNERARAIRNGKKITKTEAIRLAAIKVGISPSTLRRHLMPYNRKQ